MGCLKGHFQWLWCPWTGCHPCKATQWSHWSTTANACTGEEGLDGVGVSDRGAGGFAGPAQGS